MNKNTRNTMINVKVPLKLYYYSIIFNALLMGDSLSSGHYSADDDNMSGLGGVI